MKRFLPTATILAINIFMEITYVTGFVSGQTFTEIFQLSKEQLGFFFGMASIGWLIMSPFAGHYAHRWGAFRTQIFGIAMTLPGLFILLSARNYVMLLVGSGWIGVTCSFIAIANATLLADLFPRNLRRIAALAAALWFGGSGLMAPVIGRWLTHAKTAGYQASGFRWVYGLDILLLALGMVAAWRFVRPAARILDKRASEKHEEEDAGANSLRRTDQHWMWIIPLAMLHGLMLIPLYTWSTKMAQDKFGMTETDATFVLTAVSLGLACGRLILAAAKIRVDDRSLLAGSALAGAVLFAVGLQAPGYYATILAMGAGGFLVCATYPCIVAIIGTRFGKVKSKLYGVMGASVSLGGLIGPPLAGVIADQGVPLYKALIISPIAAVALGLCALAWRLQDRQRTGPDGGADATQ